MSSVLGLGLERISPWPWPRNFFVSLALSLVSSTPPLVKIADHRFEEILLEIGFMEKMRATRGNKEPRSAPNLVHSSAKIDLMRLTPYHCTSVFRTFCDIWKRWLCKVSCSIGLSHFASCLLYTKNCKLAISCGITCLMFDYETSRFFILQEILQSHTFLMSPKLETLANDFESNGLNLFFWIRGTVCGAPHSPVVSFSQHSSLSAIETVIFSR